MAMLHIVGLLVSVLLHLLDQASDVFVALLYWSEGRVLPAAFTLLLVLVPGFFVFVCELKQTCLGRSSVLRAVAYLTLSPLWAVIVHLYSLFKPSYTQVAFHYKTLEAFLEASPQLVLQLSLFFSGGGATSLRAALEPLGVAEALGQTHAWAPPTANATSVPSVEVLGRVYGQDSMSLFGWFHITSVVVSLLSVLSSAVAFNDLEAPIPGDQGRSVSTITDLKYRLSAQTSAKMCVGLPFYSATLVFRAVALALIVTYTRFWAGVVLFGLFFSNVLSSLSIGDPVSRALPFAFFSLLVPVGFGSSPNPEFRGHSFPCYAKAPLRKRLEEAVVTSNGGEQEELTRAQEDPPDDRDIRRSGLRARYFLTAHVASSLLLLGPAVLVTMILVQVYPEYSDRAAAFYPDRLNTLFLPLLGLSLGLSLLLARPYHRCECSGGEAPRGNFIV